jgi:hypothetical protein
MQNIFYIIFWLGQLHIIVEHQSFIHKHFGYSLQIKFKLRGTTMRNFCFLLLATFVLGSFVYGQNKEVNSRLRDVKKIYVGELGRTDSSDIVREKIKLRLAKSGQFTVVNRQEDADAILTGTVVISQQIDGNIGDIDTKNKGVAIFYLRDAKTENDIWTYEFKPNFFNVAILTDKATRGYNQVANRTVDKMLKDAGYKDK